MCGGPIHHVNIGREAVFDEGAATDHRSRVDAARQDPAYRQRLLRQSLDALLGIQRENRLSRGATDNERLREGVNMAVRLAELIQTADDPDRDP